MVYLLQYIEETKIMSQNQMFHKVYALCVTLFGIQRVHADSISEHTFFRLVGVQSRCKIAGDGEAGRNILENIFKAVLCWIDFAVRLLCS